MLLATSKDLLMSNAALAAADFFGDMDDIFLAEAASISASTNTCSLHESLHMCKHPDIAPNDTQAASHRAILQKYGFDYEGHKERITRTYRLPRDVQATLKQHAKALGMSENSAICAAVELFLHITKH